MGFATRITIANLCRSGGRCGALRGGLPVRASGCSRHRLDLSRFRCRAGDRRWVAASDGLWRIERLGDRCADDLHGGDAAGIGPGLAGSSRQSAGMAGPALWGEHAGRRGRRGSGRVPPVAQSRFVCIDLVGGASQPCGGCTRAGGAFPNAGPAGKPPGQAPTRQEP